MRTAMTLFGAAAVSIACASAPGSTTGNANPSQKAVAQIPDWCLSPPKDSPTSGYACGIGESRDMSIAVNAAEADGRNKLAQTIQTEMQGFEEKFQSSVRGDAGGEEVLNTFRSAIRAVTSQTLTGSRAAQRFVAAEPSGVSYRAFILMELDRGASRQALMDKVKSNDALYTRFKSTQAFDDLAARIKESNDAKAAAAKP